MSTSEEYIRFVLEQLDGVEAVTCRKMFGEYLVYVRQRPVLLVCDNCVMVTKAPELAALMAYVKAHNLKVLEGEEHV